MPHAAASGSSAGSVAKARSASSSSRGTCQEPGRTAPVDVIDFVADQLGRADRTAAAGREGERDGLGRRLAAIGGSSAISSAGTAAYGCGWIRGGRPGRRTGVVGAEESSPQMPSRPGRTLDGSTSQQV